MNTESGSGKSSNSVLGGGVSLFAGRPLEVVLGGVGDAVQDRSASTELKCFLLCVRHLTTSVKGRDSVTTLVLNLKFYAIGFRFT